jgi:hypothetical protein
MALPTLREEEMVALCSRSSLARSVARLHSQSREWSPLLPGGFRYTPSSRNERVRCSRTAPSRRSGLNLSYSLKGDVQSRGSLLTWPGEKDATWTWGEVSFQLKHPHLQVWIQVYLEQGSFLRWNNAKISQKKNHWSEAAQNSHRSKSGHSKF